MINWNTIGYIVLSIVLVGFFVGIQVAFINVNKLAVELKKKQGRRSGIIMSNFLDDPSKFMSAKKCISQKPSLSRPVPKQNTSALNLK